MYFFDNVQANPWMAVDKQIRNFTFDTARLAMNANSNDSELF